MATPITNRWLWYSVQHSSLASSRETGHTFGDEEWEKNASRLTRESCERSGSEGGREEKNWRVFFGKSGRLSKFWHSLFQVYGFPRFLGASSTSSETSSDSHGVSSPPQKESTNYTLLTKLCQSVLSYDRAYCNWRHHIIGYFFRHRASIAPTIDCAPEVCTGQ